MSEVEIVSYRPEYSREFERLNRLWIEKLFKIEPKDEKVFADPQGTILAKGGHIYFARSGERIVGCCAVVNNGQGIFELAKMGVDEDQQNKQIGTRLVSACIEKVKSLNARALVLETNASLLPAIRIYEKLGFKKVDCAYTEYARVDYCMRLDFAPTNVTESAPELTKVEN